MPSQRIGEKRERVRIERLTSTTTDTGGQTDPVVTVLATVLAAIELDPGFAIYEKLDIGGQQAVQRMRIRIDYLPSIKPADRVVETAVSARTFEIVTPPRHDAAKRETHLICVEKVS